MKPTFGLILMLAVLLFACQKDDEPADEMEVSNASISGQVIHHEAQIAHADVYLKKGVAEFPGTDVTAYDTQVKADEKGAFVFEGLSKDHYFIYAVGHDHHIHDEVTGGIPVVVNTQEENVVVTLPVTE